MQTSLYISELLLLTTMWIYTNFEIHPAFDDGMCNSILLFIYFVTILVMIWHVLALHGRNVKEDEEKEMEEWENDVRESKARSHSKSKSEQRIELVKQKGYDL